MTAHRVQAKQPPWQKDSRFNTACDDPLTGFANMMDVMLVFALGLLLALVAQNKALQQHLKIEPKRLVETGDELVDAPELIEQINQGSQGMESLGQVYRDPKTGKLLLIDTHPTSQQNNH